MNTQGREVSAAVLNCSVHYYSRINLFLYGTSGHFSFGTKSLCRWCLTKDAKYSSYFRILSVLSFYNVVQIVFRGKTNVLLFVAMFVCIPKGVGILF